MRRMGLRRLLWVVLATNLVTNTILLGGLGYMFFESYRTQDGGPGQAYGDPVDPPAGEPGTSEPAAGPDLVALRLSPAEWEKLKSGEAVRETSRAGDSVTMRARFLVEAEPGAIYSVLADPRQLVEIYDDLEKAEVRQAGEGWQVVYFEGRSGISSIEYTLRREYAEGKSITWKLAPGPGTSRMLTACAGGWFFTPTGAGHLTLVEYRNAIAISGLPDFLLEKLIDNNLPHVMKAVRERVERR